MIALKIIIYFFIVAVIGASILNIISYIRDKEYEKDYNKDWHYVGWENRHRNYEKRNDNTDDY